MPTTGTVLAVLVLVARAPGVVGAAAGTRRDAVPGVTCTKLGLGSRVPAGARPSLLALRGGANSGAGEKGTDPGAGPEASRPTANSGSDRDKHMRDDDAGPSGRAPPDGIGVGVPCTNWREYRPNTEAERRREAKLADLFDSNLLKEGDLDVASINRLRESAITVAEEALVAFKEMVCACSAPLSCLSPCGLRTGVGPSADDRARTAWAVHGQGQPVCIPDAHAAQPFRAWASLPPWFPWAWWGAGRVSRVPGGAGGGRLARWRIWCAV